MVLPRARREQERGLLVLGRICKRHGATIYEGQMASMSLNADARVHDTAQRQ